MRRKTTRLSKVRFLLSVVALTLFSFATVSGQCPPNGWYCPQWPENCDMVGCAKACGDCPWLCTYSKKTRAQCPPLTECLACVPN